MKSAFHDQVGIMSTSWSSSQQLKKPGDEADQILKSVPMMVMVLDDARYMT